jgi:hypothetical protein
VAIVVVQVLEQSGEIRTGITRAMDAVGFLTLSFARVSEQSSVLPFHCKITSVLKKFFREQFRPQID